MIAVLAEDAVKNPRMISFSVNLEMKIRVESPDIWNSRLGILFGDRKLSGYIIYRRFPMASVMMPAHVSFCCRIEKKSGTTFFDLPEVSCRKFEKNASLLFYQVPHFSCDSDIIAVIRPHFQYDQDVLSRFRERVALINDYYAANAILDTLDRKVRLMEPGDVNRYPVYFILLEELNKILAIIKEKDFPQHLNLDSLDPEGFNEKYQRLSRFSQSATMTFRENLKTPGSFAYSASPDFLIRQFLDGISNYIRWSMLVTERNSGIYREYLDSYFRRNAFGDDRGVIRNLAGKIYPGMNPDSAMAMVSAMINQAYHERADELMNEMQYADAVELLRNAHDFCEANPYLKGKGNDRGIITKAANGIYNSYLGVADGAIRNGKQEMARSYLVRAQNYRKEHAAWVSSDSLFNEVFQQLASESLSRCDGMFASALYPDALDCYRDFEKGFDSLTLSSVKRVLEPKIRFCRYKMLIAEGQQNLAKQDKPEAGRYFFLARQLAQENRLPADTLLDSLCRVTYPFYLVNLLNKGEERIWANQTGMARRLADSIAYIQRTTGVESSRELSDALAGYRRKLDDHICYNATEAVEVFLIRAIRERELKNFIPASEHSDSAVFLIRQNPDCLINPAGVSDSIRKYGQAVSFQKMMKRIDIYVETGLYSNAISAYSVMEHFYSSENIRRFSLVCVPMYEYVRDKSITDLTIKAFKYFRIRKNAGQALLYLKLLRLEDYPRKSARPFLEWLGKEYAEQDFRDQPEADPVVLVRKYTGSDPWMKRFRFAYYSQAQYLRHKPSIKYLLRKFYP